MNIEQQSAGKLVTSQYRDFGEYVNLHRHIPNIEDGLKVSYRHLIQTAYEYASNNLMKTAALIGTNMKCLHPHGDLAQKDIVTELVRNGIFEGQGNFGCEFLIGGNAVAAAPRYTEVKLSHRYVDLIKLLVDYVPKFDNELNYREFTFIPTPVPIGLSIGYLGIGLGTGCKIPAFTQKSILDAYIHDDPWRLESRFGLKIEHKSELDELWTKGRGRIYFSLKRYWDDYKYYIEGHKGPLNINYSKIMAWRDQGRIDFDDETANRLPKIGFYKMPRVQWPSESEIEEEINRITSGSVTYLVRVVKDNQVIDIGLRDWIEFTYRNYRNLLVSKIKDQIEDLEEDIIFYRNFRKIADKIINCPDKEYKEIAKELGIHEKFVEKASTRTIGTLRRYDPSGKVNECEQRIKELKHFDADKYIEDTISN